MPICGLSQSASPMPTARSIPREVMASMPSVTILLRGLISGSPCFVSDTPEGYPPGRATPSARLSALSPAPEMPLAAPISHEWEHQVASRERGGGPESGADAGDHGLRGVEVVGEHPDPSPAFPRQRLEAVDVAAVLPRVAPMLVTVVFDDHLLLPVHEVPARDE